MPRIWADSLEQHKADVRSAVMSTAAEFAATGGVRSLTMSKIAEGAGISRATLYTYFSDVDEILHSWHRSMVDQHLAVIEKSIEKAVDDPASRLRAACEQHLDVLATHHNSPLLQPDHTQPDIAEALARLHHAFATLIAAALPTKAQRSGLNADDFASYLLAALDAAARFPTRTARRHLLELVTQPPPTP